QADMRQAPTQLNEVPWDEQTPIQRQQTLQRQQQQQLQQQRLEQQQRAQQQRLEQQQRAQQQQLQQQQRLEQQQRAQQQVTQQTHMLPQNGSQPVSMPKAQESSRAKQQETTQAKAVEKAKSQRWMVQCGSFKGSDQAESIRAQLAFEGFESRITNGGGWHRVVIGPYNSRTGADATLKRLRSSGHSSCIPLAVGG
ncbi:MAG: cell division protein FtsN, partial [Pantoea sp.]|nr:cell division protein FtsN [Pantoea sp.]